MFIINKFKSGVDVIALLLMYFDIQIMKNNKLLSLKFNKPINKKILLLDILLNIIFRIFRKDTSKIIIDKFKL